MNDVGVARMLPVSLRLSGSVEGGLNVLKLRQAKTIDKKELLVVCHLVSLT